MSNQPLVMAKALRRHGPYHATGLTCLPPDALQLIASYILTEAPTAMRSLMAYALVSKHTAQASWQCVPFPSQVLQPQVHYIRSVLRDTRISGGGKAELAGPARGLLRLSGNVALRGIILSAPLQVASGSNVELIGCRIEKGVEALSGTALKLVGCTIFNAQGGCSCEISGPQIPTPCLTV